MIAKAITRYLRMTPRKVGYVIRPLRNKSVGEAMTILQTTNKRAAKPVAKAIASAFANAKQADPTLTEDRVLISRLFADGGPVWKRFRAAAFGRAVPLRKPTTHITVELDRVTGRTPAASPAPQAAARRRRPLVAAAGARAGKTRTRSQRQ